MVIALSGQGDCGFAVAGDRIRVCAVGGEKLADFEMAVGGRRDEGRIACGITVVGIGAVLQQPFDDRNVAAGDGTRERGIAAAIRGDSVDAGTARGKELDDWEMSEDGGEGDDGKTVGREGVGVCPGISEEFLHAGKIAHGGGIVELQDGAASEEQVADFAPAVVDGEKNRGDAGWIGGGHEKGLGVEIGLDDGEIAGADGFEEGAGVGHK